MNIISSGDKSIKTPGVLSFSLDQFLDAIKPLVYEVSNPVDKQYKDPMEIEVCSNGILQWKFELMTESAKDPSSTTLGTKKVKLDNKEETMPVVGKTVSRRKKIFREKEDESTKNVLHIYESTLYLLEKKETRNYPELNETGVPKKDGEGKPVYITKELSIPWAYEEAVLIYSFEQFMYKSDYIATRYRIRTYNKDTKALEEETNFVFREQDNQIGSAASFRAVEIPGFSSNFDAFFGKIPQELNDPLIDLISNLVYGIYAHNNNGTPSASMGGTLATYHSYPEIMDSQQHMHANESNPFGFLMSLSRKFLVVSWQKLVNKVDTTFDMVFAKVIEPQGDRSIIYKIPEAISSSSSTKVYAEQVKDKIKAKLKEYYSKFKLRLSTYRNSDALSIPDAYELLKHFVKIEFEWPEDVWSSWKVWAMYEERIYKLHAHYFEGLDYDTAGYIIKLGFLIGLQEFIDSHTSNRSSSGKRTSRMAVKKDSATQSVNMNFFKEFHPDKDKRGKILRAFNRVCLGEAYVNLEQLVEKVELSQSSKEKMDHAWNEVLPEYKDVQPAEDKKVVLIEERSVSRTTYDWWNSFRPIEMMKRMKNSSKTSQAETLTRGLMFSAPVALPLAAYSYGSAGIVSGVMSYLGGFSLLAPVITGVKAAAVGTLGAVGAVGTTGATATAAAGALASWPVLVGLTAAGLALYAAQGVAGQAMGYLSKKVSQNLVAPLVDGGATILGSWGRSLKGDTKYKQLFELAFEDDEDSRKNYKKQAEENKREMQMKNILHFLTNFGAFDIYGDMTLVLDDLGIILQKIESHRSIKETIEMFEIVKKAYTFLGQPLPLGLGEPTQYVRYMIVEFLADPTTMTKKALGGSSSTPSKKRSSQIRRSSAGRRREMFMQIYKYDKVSTWEWTKDKVGIERFDEIEVFCSLTALTKLFNRDFTSSDSDDETTTKAPAPYEIVNFFDMDNTVENMMLIKLTDKKTGPDRRVSYWMYGHKNNFQTQNQVFFDKENKPGYPLWEYLKEHVSWPLVLSLKPSAPPTPPAPPAPASASAPAVPAPASPPATTTPLPSQPEALTAEQLKTLASTEEMRQNLQRIIRRQNIYDVNIKQPFLVKLKPERLVNTTNSYTTLATSTDLRDDKVNYLIKPTFSTEEEAEFRKIQRIFNQFIKKKYEEVTVSLYTDKTYNSMENVKRRIYWKFLQKYYPIHDVDVNNMIRIKDDMIYRALKSAQADRRVSSEEFKTPQVGVSLGLTTSSSSSSSSSPIAAGGGGTKKRTRRSAGTRRVRVRGRVSFTRKR